MLILNSFLRNHIRALGEQGFVPLKIDYMMPPLDGLRSRSLAVVLRKIMLKLENTPMKYLACHIIVISAVGKICTE